ncbi:hypothetical protein [Ammoniphilus resinae]|uniref:Uncharacterized protein n=1 Tax=Ammoniphilus resinae TaxID=861532 RepID=A0ABS4GTZ6_9BACL|nr:hypothetical protein [Ammoniphilus resinae]MBP1933748.1 hypothetical protein [Ammoniphilus resinae]
MIYLEPQFRNEHGEILNVIDMKGKAVGYLSYMYKEGGDIYILGQLDEEGEKQNFLDITTHYINGLKQSVAGDSSHEPYVYINMGGETLKFDGEQDQEESDSDSKEES